MLAQEMHVGEESREYPLNQETIMNLADVAIAAGHDKQDASLLSGKVVTEHESFNSALPPAASRGRALAGAVLGTQEGFNSALPPK